MASSVRILFYQHETQSNQSKDEFLESISANILEETIALLCCDEAFLTHRAIKTVPLSYDKCISLPLSLICIFHLRQGDLDLDDLMAASSPVPMDTEPDLADAEPSGCSAKAAALYGTQVSSLSHCPNQSNSIALSVNQH